MPNILGLNTGVFGKKTKICDFARKGIDTLVLYSYNEGNFVETGGRKRPSAEKTLEKPARVPKVQGCKAESLRQKDGDIRKV